MTKRTDYPSNIEIAPEVSDEEDRAGFHEAAFLAALHGLCANPFFMEKAWDVCRSEHGMKEDLAVHPLIVEGARLTADAALDHYPFITDETQLKKKEQNQ